MPLLKYFGKINRVLLHKTTKSSSAKWAAQSVYEKALLVAKSTHQDNGNAFEQRYTSNLFYVCAKRRQLNLLMYPI